MQRDKAWAWAAVVVIAAAAVLAFVLSFVGGV